MHEISPVLAGTFDAADYAPAATNFNQPADNSVADTSSTAAVDARRYTKWDHSASQVADAGDFTFDDFLDMINPLEHIPVISSIYRAATDENINPVSRVAGDIMYGGVFGIGSAVMGGLSSAVDSMVVASTGHDVSGYVLASIFGTDDAKKDTTQVAQTDQAPSTTAPADPSTTAALAALATPSTNPNSVQNQPDAGAPSSSPATTSVAGLTLAQAKAFPLTPNTKLPYGGAMAPPSVEAQNAAMALSEGSHAMRMGNMIYTSPLMNGPHPLPVSQAPAPKAAAPDSNAQSNNAAADSAVPPVSSAAAAPVANEAVADATPKMGPQKNPIPQNLIDDMVMLRALNQYKGVASGPATTGSTIDLTN